MTMDLATQKQLEDLKAMREVGEVHKSTVKPEVFRCAFCGYYGVFGKDVVMIGYYDDITHRDTHRVGCKDINKCMDRGGGHRAVYS
jgi:hypothetical protein